jgi:hypothetical protein
MFIIFAIGYALLALLFWVPIVAGLLWAFTFISYDVTFSWIFVAIVSAILSLITGLIFAALLDA